MRIYFLGFIKAAVFFGLNFFRTEPACLILCLCVNCLCNEDKNYSISDEVKLDIFPCANTVLAFWSLFRHLSAGASACTACISGTYYDMTGAGHSVISDRAAVCNGG
jgi:hypothetical protein